MPTTIPFALLAATLFCSLLATPVQATSTETWVSGNGNDANSASDCQRTAPCQTFFAALPVTIAGGTVFCADPVSSGGLLTISKDVTIECSGGAVPASCLGGNGIDINTAGITVTLRGLAIYGVLSPCPAQPIGINITAAALVRLEHCKIYGFKTAGVEVAPSAGNVEVEIQDSAITKNSVGVLIAPTGGAGVQMSIERSQIENSAGGGLKATSASSGAIILSIADSSISQNASNGVNAVSGATNVVVNLTRDEIALNGLAGVQANGTNAAVLIDNTSLLSNGSALSAVASGRLLSYTTNRIVGPPGSGFTGSAPLQ